MGWRSFVSLCLVLCIQNAFFATSVLELSCKQGILLENENIFGIVQGVNITENDMVTAMERYDQTVYQVIGKECVQSIKSNK